jgi:hypothetical protein
MRANPWDRMIGRYCKIVMKEPGDEKPHTVTGIIKEVNCQDGFLLVKSDSDFWCLNINGIVAIKPKKE